MPAFERRLIITMKKIVKKSLAAVLAAGMTMSSVFAVSFIGLTENPVYAADKTALDAAVSDGSNADKNAAAADAADVFLPTGGGYSVKTGENGCLELYDADKQKILSFSEEISKVDTYQLAKDGYMIVTDKQGKADILDKDGTSWNQTDQKFDSVKVIFSSTKNGRGYYIAAIDGVEYILSKNNDVNTNLTEEINKIREKEGYDNTVKYHYSTKNGSLIVTFQNKGTDDSIYVLVKTAGYAQAEKLDGNAAVWNGYSYVLTYDNTEDGKKVIRQMYESGSFRAIGAPTGVVCDEIEAADKEAGYLFDIQSEAGSYKAGEGFYSNDDMYTMVLQNGATVISDAAVDAILEQNAVKPVLVKANDISFEFAAGTMKRVDGVDAWDFGSVQTDDYETAENLPNGVTASNFAYYINFNYSGVLPGTAQITIPLGIHYANKTLYYSQLLDDGTIELVQKVTADENGNITVTQDHCSTYIVTTEEIGETASPKTGDTSRIFMYTMILVGSLLTVSCAAMVCVRKRDNV